MIVRVWVHNRKVIPMKKILFAFMLLLASVGIAEAGYQYSPEQPSLLDEILGTNDSGWSMTPIPHQARVRHRFHTSEYRHTQPSVAYSRHDNGF